MEALSLQNVSFGYSKDHEVLKNLSLSVQFGGITGLIGPNGSGKSTLIRVAGDLLKPQTGEVHVCAAPNDAKEAKRNSILVASNDYRTEFLTGVEYLQFIHRMYGLKCDLHELKRLFMRYQMEHRWGDLIEDYSHGMRKKVQLIAALMVARPLTMIDETPNGIDIEALYSFEADLLELAAGDHGVLLCTHDFAMLERIADTIILLSHGRILVHEDCQSLVSKYGTIDAFVKDSITRDQGTCGER